MVPAYYPQPHVISTHKTHVISTEAQRSGETPVFFASVFAAAVSTPNQGLSWPLFFRGRCLIS